MKGTDMDEDNSERGENPCVFLRSSNPRLGRNPKDGQAKEASQ